MRVPGWIAHGKDALVMIIKAAIRSVLVVLLFGALLEQPLVKDPVTTDTLVLCWLPLAAYSVTAVVLIVTYFPVVAKTGSHQLFYYLWDLSLHAALLIVIYALIYKRIGLLSGGEAITEPLDFLYFSIVTWTTLGYGDIVPVSGARMFAASEAVCGYVFMGLYLAIVLHVLTKYAERENPKQ